MLFAVLCSGLLLSDILMRGHHLSAIEVSHESETQLQKILQRVQRRGFSLGVSTRLLGPGCRKIPGDWCKYAVSGKSFTSASKVYSG